MNKSSVDGRVLLPLILIAALCVAGDAEARKTRAKTDGPTFTLDIKMVCTSLRNDDGEVVPLRDFSTDPPASSVEYRYPSDYNPENFSWATAVGYPQGLGKFECTGTRTSDEKKHTGLYALYLKYEMPSEPPSNEDCPDDNSGHGNDCPKDDKDNPSGKPGPGSGNGGGSTSTGPSGVGQCTMKEGDDHLYSLVYRAYCGDNITVTGHLQYLPPTPESTSNGSFSEADLPFWFNSESEELPCNPNCGDVDKPYRLDLSQVPMKLEGKGKKAQSVPDPRACALFFPLKENEDEESVLDEREILRVKEVYPNSNCTPGQGLVVEGANRTCHNDYAPDQTCYVDPETGPSSTEPAMTSLSYVLLDNPPGVRPNTINVKECLPDGRDNSVFKVVIYGEEYFDVRTISGLGDGINEPAEPREAPIVIPSNFHADPDETGNKVEDALFDGDRPFAYVEAEERAVTFSDENGDFIEDVRITYKGCDPEGFTSAKPGPNGLVQAVNGGNPDGKKLSVNGTLDITVLGQFELSPTTKPTFKTSKENHSVNRD